MFRVEKISSLDLPELQPYRHHAASGGTRSQGIFVAEGEKSCAGCWKAVSPSFRSCCRKNGWTDFRPLLEARPEPITVYLAEKTLLETLTGFSMFQGVLAVGKIPPPVSLDELLSTNRKPRLLVAVDGLTNAENLGALVRNCVAFGVQALLVGETCSSPFCAGLVRNSMGTVFQLPVIETGENGQRHRSSPSRTSSAETLPGECLQELRATRRPLHRRASAHGQKVFVAGGFLR